MLNDFVNILNHGTTRHFLQKSIKTLYHEDYPFCTYMGFNYRDDELINAKFYVTGFKKVDFDLIRTFFPFHNEIENAYAKYEESRIFDTMHMGTAFVLKMDRSLRDGYTFFIKLKEIPHTPVSKIKLLHPEPKIVDDYFAFEKTDGDSYQKRYYPILNRENISHLLDSFGVNAIDHSKVNFIEYLEYKDESKITMPISDTDYLNDYLKRTNGEKLIELNEFMRDKFDLHPMATSNYKKGNVKSVYYMLKGDNVDFKNSFALLRLNDKISNMYPIIL
jgi:hypothetical protein